MSEATLELSPCSKFSWAWRKASGRGAKCKWLEADLVYLEDCLEVEPRTYNSLQLSEKLAQDTNVQLSPSRLRRLLKKKVETETHPPYS